MAVVAAAAVTARVTGSQKCCEEDVEVSPCVVRAWQLGLAQCVCLSVDGDGRSVFE
jgi:hypothetical protein